MAKEKQVKTQAELDQALKDGFIPLLIGNGYFEVRGSSQVTACGSSQVRACGSSQVTACGSSQVRACGSSQVTACDSSQVRASKFVAVSVHGTACKIVGGHVIKIIKPKTALQWLTFYGVPVKRGVVVLFKAVDAEYKANYNKFPYLPGDIPTAPDWDGGLRECGGGLHFCAHPVHALKFHDRGKKFMACPVRVKDIRPPKSDDQHPTKVKAKGCCAPIWECDINGNAIKPLPAQEPAPTPVKAEALPAASQAAPAVPTVTDSSLFGDTKKKKKRR